jgi:hypothetical protein
MLAARVAEDLRQTIPLQLDSRELPAHLRRWQDLAGIDHDVVLLHLDSAALPQLHDVVELEAEEPEQAFRRDSDGLHRVHVEPHASVRRGAERRFGGEGHVDSLVKCAFHLETTAVVPDANVLERRPLVAERESVQQRLQARHVHGNHGARDLHHVRTAVVEDRRAIGTADHLAAQRGDIEDDAVRDVQADVLHGDLNGGCFRCRWGRLSRRLSRRTCCGDAIVTRAATAERGKEKPHEHASSGHGLVERKSCAVGG